LNAVSVVLFSARDQFFVYFVGADSLEQWM
jgi:hypothetical protein